MSQVNALDLPTGMAQCNQGCADGAGMELVRVSL